MKKLFLLLALFITTISCYAQITTVHNGAVKVTSVPRITVGLDTLVFYGADQNMKSVYYTDFLAKISADVVTTETDPVFVAEEPNIDKLDGDQTITGDKVHTGEVRITGNDALPWEASLAVNAGYVFNNYVPFTQSGTAGEDLLTGQIVYQNATAYTWLKASASVLLEATGKLGVVSSGGTNGNPIGISFNIMINGSGWTPGDVLYLSPTAGVVTTVQPTGTDYVRIIGTTIDATMRYVNPSIVNWIKADGSEVNGVAMATGSIQKFGTPVAGRLTYWHDDNTIRSTSGLNELSWDTEIMKIRGLTDEAAIGLSIGEIGTGNILTIDVEDTFGAQLSYPAGGSSGNFNINSGKNMNMSSGSTSSMTLTTQTLALKPWTGATWVSGTSLGLFSPFNTLALQNAEGAGSNMVATNEFVKDYVANNTSGSPLTTKGDVYTYSTVDARKGVGADWSILTANSSDPTGLTWEPNDASYVLYDNSNSPLLSDTVEDALDEIVNDVLPDYELSLGNPTVDNYILSSTIAGVRTWVLDAGGSGDTHPIDDGTAIVKGSVDATKLVRVEADGVATGTTRVLTMPDNDVDLGTMVTTNTAQTISGQKTFSTSTLFTGSSGITVEDQVIIKQGGTSVFTIRENLGDIEMYSTAGYALNINTLNNQPVNFGTSITDIPIMQGGTVKASVDPLNDDGVGDRGYNDLRYAAIGAGGGTIGGSILDNQIAVGATIADDIEGSSGLTWNGAKMEATGGYADFNNFWTTNTYTGIGGFRTYDATGSVNRSDFISTNADYFVVSPAETNGVHTELISYMGDLVLGADSGTTINSGRLKIKGTTGTPNAQILLESNNGTQSTINQLQSGNMKFEVTGTTDIDFFTAGFKRFTIDDAGTGTFTENVIIDRGLGVTMRASIESPTTSGLYLLSAPNNTSGHVLTSTGALVDNGSPIPSTAATELLYGTMGLYDTTETSSFAYESISTVDGKWFDCAHASTDITVTLDSGVARRTAYFAQTGAAQIIFVAGSGVTIKYPTSITTPKTKEEGSVVAAVWKTATLVHLVGNLEDN